MKFMDVGIDIAYYTIVLVTAVLCMYLIMIFKIFKKLQIVFTKSHYDQATMDG